MDKKLVTSKSGHQYWRYPSTYKKLCNPRKGRLVTAKSGKTRYYYYEKKCAEFGVPRYSKVNIAKARERDGYSCQYCGSTKNLQVHHIDNAGSTITEIPDNNLDNLITLCTKCHMRLHYQSIDKYQNIIDLRHEGITLAEIGRIYGVSRQRIYRIMAKINAR